MRKFAAEVKCVSAVGLVVSISFLTLDLYGNAGRDASQKESSVSSTDRIEEFADVGDVRKHFVPQKKAKRAGLWKMVSRHVAFYDRKNYSPLLSAGDIISMNSDTIYTIPLSDFVVENCFRYKENGRLKEGKVVAVDIQIAVLVVNADEDSRIKMSAWDACMRSLDRFVDSGYQIPRQNAERMFAKTGERVSRRIKQVAFKTNARDRFGAKSVTYLEGYGNDGKIRVLLLDCNPKRENLKIKAWSGPVGRTK